MAAKWFCIAVFVLASAGAALAQDEINVIVGFNGAADGKTLEKHGGTVRSSNAAAGFVAGRISPRAIGRLRRESNVAFVEEDHVAVKTAYPANWGHTRVRADLASSNGSYVNETGTVRVRVAVCDTGIDLTHPALVGQTEFGANFTTSPDADVDGHGSHVSGTIVALPVGDPAVTGVASGAVAVEVKVLDDTGSGYYSWIANGIHWSADNGCRVINMSLGGRFGSSLLSSAINTAWSKNVVICAAAGNDGTKSASYPAYYTNCIAVAATDNTLPATPLSGRDVRAWFSNHGTWVDVSAPGVYIWSTTGGGYESWHGTSMATPHVSGAAALVISKNPLWSNSSVRSKLQTTKGPTVDNKRFTPGIINCQAATQ